MNARLSRVRLAHVDDHEAMRRGLAAILDDHPEFRLVVSAATIGPVRVHLAARAREAK